MQHIEIKIQTLEDAAKGENPFNHMANGCTEKIHGNLQAVQILEGGMQSGKTSLMFISKIKDKLVVLECSAAMMESINGAVMGAVARFGDLKKKRG